jgi:hypothetical protein
VNRTGTAVGTGGVGLEVGVAGMGVAVGGTLVSVGLGSTTSVGVAWTKVGSGVGVSPAELKRLQPTMKRLTSIASRKNTVIDVFIPPPFHIPVYAFFFYKYTCKLEN